MNPNQQDASLYIHIPFCTQRCSYCDFFFVTTKHKHEDFVDALCLELIQVARNFPDTSISTVYFGGGTPSRLPPKTISRILKQIRACFDLHQVREITLEANPEDITVARLEEFLEYGITRISLGVQSFRDTDLAFMNRCHNSNQALQACNLIQSAGFSSWSLDLIFGVPGSTMRVWKENLQYAVEIGVPHISTYSLTIEPYTPLHKQVKRGEVNPVSDEQTSGQFQQAIKMLKASGFEHYEISSFARPGHRSQHNTKYWHHMNYLGFGPSAHSFWWENGKAHRWENIRNLRLYMELLELGNSPIENREFLSERDLVRERIMLALRTSEGLDLEDLQRDYGFSLNDHKQEVLKTMKARDLLTWDGTSIRLSSNGVHVCDRLTEQLWPD